MTTTVFSGCSKLLKLIRPDDNETEQTETKKEITAKETESETETEHIHSFGEWYTAVQPTCTDDGYEERVCSGCGEKETRTLSALGHDYAANSACNRCGDIFDTVAFSELNVIKNANVGAYVIFGTYEQDNDLSNGKEGIEWLILDKKDDRVLVTSRYGLDCKPYNETGDIVTWETCSMRAWLNGEFLKSSFSAGEYNAIINSTVTADDNPVYNTPAGNNTTDRVFLLSIPEVYKYLSTAESRGCAPTKYAVASGAYLDENGNCWWWMRSPGLDVYSATGIYPDGTVDDSGNHFDFYLDAARPAMWIYTGD